MLLLSSRYYKEIERRVENENQLLQLAKVFTMWISWKLSLFTFLTNICWKLIFRKQMEPFWNFILVENLAIVDKNRIWNETKRNETKFVSKTINWNKTITSPFGHEKKKFIKSWIVDPNSNGMDSTHLWSLNTDTNAELCWTHAIIEQIKMHSNSFGFYSSQNSQCEMFNCVWVTAVCSTVHNLKPIQLFFFFARQRTSVMKNRNEPK